MGFVVAEGVLVSGLSGSGLGVGSLGGGDLIFEAGVVLAVSLGGGDLSFSGSGFLAAGSVFFAKMSSTLFVGVVGVFCTKISHFLAQGLEHTKTLKGIIDI